jgi:peptidoglycan/xylan/chitin deacetylase (PgdA/CDA1 family)
MAKKSSFNLRRYRHKTGAICPAGDSECGTRDSLSNGRHNLHAREQIFDDEIVIGKQKSREDAAVHYFSDYRIHRTRFTISTLGIILTLGVWLGLVVVHNVQTRQITEDQNNNLAGIEIIVPDAGGDQNDNPDVPAAGDDEAGKGNGANGGNSAGSGEVWAPLPLDDGTNKYIALTFDDGPSPSTTPRLLNILERENIHATFFVIGNLAARNPQILSRMVADGHVVGSHSWSHSDLSKMSSSGIINDLTKTANAIKAATGSEPTLLRPPYGAVSRTLQNSSNLPLILWSVDTRDWESRNVNSIYNIVVRNVKSGSIILFHDIYPTTITAVERLIPALKKAGYTFVTVPELLGSPLQNGKIYYGARS